MFSTNSFWLFDWQQKYWKLMNGAPDFEGCWPKISSTDKSWLKSSVSDRLRARVVFIEYLLSIQGLASLSYWISCRIQSIFARIDVSMFQMDIFHVSDEFRRELSLNVMSIIAILYLAGFFWLVSLGLIPAQYRS